jgi:hypothetical protein
MSDLWCPQSALDVPTKAVHNMSIPEFGEEDGEDGRVPCESCGRKFKRSRVAEHQLICVRHSKREAQRKAKMKVVTGEELRLRDTDFAGYRDRRSDVEWKSRWREEHEVIQSVAKAEAALAESAAAAASESTAAAPEGEAEHVITGLPEDGIIRTGFHVTMDDGRTGVVRFKGPVFMLAKGQWYGVELDRAEGKNNGDFRGESNNRVLCVCMSVRGVLIGGLQEPSTLNAVQAMGSSPASTASPM